MMQQGELAILLDFINVHVDFIGGLADRADGDAHGIFQMLSDQAGNRGFERRREEQSLPVGRSFAKNAFDGGQEAHIEHAVRFIQHDDADGGESDQFAVEEIAQAAGRRNNHLRALPDGLQLAGFAHAADDYGGADAGARREDQERFVNLQREFARRAQDESLRARGQRLAAQRFEDRESEREGLAGTGLCGGNDVVSEHGGRDRLRLDGRRRNESLCCEVLAEDRGSD